MKIKGLSASSYDSYTWCEFQFYLTQILGFYDESGPAATLGHLSHHVLEILSRLSILKHKKDSKYWNAEYLWQICFNHYAKERPDIFEKIDSSKLKKVAKGTFALINSEYSPINERTIAAETPFSIPVQDNELAFEIDGQKHYLNLRGRIDRIDKINDSTIEIMDYKTGTRTNYKSSDRAKKDEISLRDEIQPRLYHLAAKHLFPWAENIIVTFIYLADGGPISVPFCDQDIHKTYDMIKKRYFTIKNNSSPQKTSEKWKCRSLCSFYKDGTCDGVYKEMHENGYDFTTTKYVTLNYDSKKFKR